jgi:hypothetical protein
MNFCHLLTHMAQENLLIISTYLSLVLVLNMNCPIVNKLGHSLRGYMAKEIPSIVELNVHYSVHKSSVLHLTQNITTLLL